METLSSEAAARCRREVPPLRPMGRRRKGVRKRHPPRSASSSPAPQHTPLNRSACGPWSLHRGSRAHPLHRGRGMDRSASPHCLKSPGAAALPRVLSPTESGAGRGRRARLAPFGPRVFVLVIGRGRDDLGNRRAGHGPSRLCAGRSLRPARRWLLSEGILTRVDG